MSKAGYCIQTTKYDKNGMMLSQTFLDTKGNPVNNTSGFATIKYKANADGTTTQEHYDEKGNKVD